MGKIHNTTPDTGDTQWELIYKVAKKLDDGLALDASDIEIGAVEIKNSTTDDRATVAADGRLATDANLQIANTDAPGGAGAVSASTPRVTLASDDPAVAALGATTGAKVITDANGTLQQYLRGLVYLFVTAGQALVTATISAGTNSIGGTKDNGPHWTPAHGIASVPFTSADATTAVAVTSAPTGGQKLVITDLFVSNNSGVDLQFTFQEETSATVMLGPVALPAGTSAQYTPRGRWKLATADKKLFVDVSAAGNVMVDAHYFSEA